MCKISLIIPVYNSEKFLEKLLNSILKQTYKNFEIILVNDGSTDRSLNIINTYIENNKNIKCVTTENNGPGVARRIGFNLSTGDLLFFIDSDDYLPSNKILKKIADIYQHKEFDMLLFNFILNYEKKQEKTNTFYDSKLKEGFIDKKYIEKNKMGGALWEKIFVKKIMKDNDFCDYVNYEDYYTTYKYLNNCKKIYYTEEVLYYSNRDNESSISKKTNAKKYVIQLNY